VAGALPPFYGSTDLRNSGFKLAPVDLNLFPGGFNNLNDAFMPLCVQAAQAAIERICAGARSILLIPENHTRNQFYLQNVAKLVSILRLTGLEVRLGSLLPEITDPPWSSSPTAQPDPRTPGAPRQPPRPEGLRPLRGAAQQRPVRRHPRVLKNLDQWVIPPVHAGWHTRRKSNHAAAYDRVTRDFGAAIGIDPWRINPAFDTCSGLDFHARTGEQELADKVAAMLDGIRAKYKEYGQRRALRGGQGRRRHLRHGRHDGQGRRRADRPQPQAAQQDERGQGRPGGADVIIQEGVHTFETVNGAVAEPVVYMMDHYVVGGFYRVHTQRGRDENLNAPGMHFEPLAFEAPCSLPDCNQEPDAAPTASTPTAWWPAWPCWPPRSRSKKPRRPWPRGR
jgi:glutamate--cysteine ligase